MFSKRQHGSGLPVFYGARHQRGMGLGNVFKTFYKWFVPVFKTHAMPALKSSAESLGAEAIRAVSNIANDTINGKNIHESFKERSNEAIKSLSSKAEAAIIQHKGSGFKRPKVNESSVILKKNSKRSRRAKDIFDF